MWEIEKLANDLQEIGKKLVEKAKGDEDTIYEWDMQIRDESGAETILCWDDNAYPCTYELEVVLTPSGFTLMDVNDGGEVSFKEALELLARWGDRNDEKRWENMLRTVKNEALKILQEGRWVLVCPKCHEVSEGKGWTLTFDAVEQANVVLDQENGFRTFTKSEVVDRELAKASHECGFETYEWDADDFAVYLEGDTVKKVGAYWGTNMDELKKIAEEKGWKVDVEVK